MNPAVLLMAHGAAGSLEEVPAYLREIFGARPVPEGLVRDITERYRAIGGSSPLLKITRTQARALELRLSVPVLVGMRNSAPTIRSAVEEARALGRDALVALPLTPYESRLSTGAYLDRLDRAVADTGGGLQVLPATGWHLHPRLIAAFEGKVRAALGRLGGRAPVILSAHSLPERAARGDLYPRQLQETAEAIAEAARLADWRFAYQSRGASGEAWLGPDVGDVIKELAGRGDKAVVVAPFGFVSEHLETLYDDDVLYRGLAESKGLRFARAAALNDDPGLIEALADVALHRLNSCAS